MDSLLFWVFAAVAAVFLIGVVLFALVLPFGLWRCLKNGEIDFNGRPIRRNTSPVMFWGVWLAGLVIWLLLLRKCWVWLIHF